jgi:predicted O-methyltransferase YrrM
MSEVASSYKNKTICYEDIFKLLVWQVKPKRIVEFGILQGYSLMSFVKSSQPTTEILAYDIFEHFVGNAAHRSIVDQFAIFPNVQIEEGDFYKKVSDFADESIDLLHIDIANDGSVYDFAFTHYLPKLSKNGIMILEGGGEERDNVYWMKKYNKIPIVTTLAKYQMLDICVLSPFPSLTIVRKT